MRMHNISSKADERVLIHCTEPKQNIYEKELMIKLVTSLNSTYKKQKAI